MTRLLSKCNYQHYSPPVDIALKVCLGLALQRFYECLYQPEKKSPPSGHQQLDVAWRLT
jgi:hypothetical protein